MFSHLRYVLAKNKDAYQERYSRFLINAAAKVVGKSWMKLMSNKKHKHLKHSLRIFQFIVVHIYWSMVIDQWSLIIISILLLQYNMEKNV